MNNTVYVTNFTGHEYTNAEQYGELVYLTKGFVSFDNLNSIKSRVSEFIKQANNEDYLLLSGNNLICALATNLWLNYHTQCKILHWNGLKREYGLHILTNEN